MFKEIELHAANLYTILILILKNNLSKREREAGEREGGGKEEYMSIQ